MVADKRAQQNVCDGVSRRTGRRRDRTRRLDIPPYPVRPHRKHTRLAPMSLLLRHRHRALISSSPRLLQIRCVLGWLSVCMMHAVSGLRVMET
jgi:hypothetical protein